jgi:X-Pro dipeptidyl-peptidase
MRLEGIVRGGPGIPLWQHDTYSGRPDGVCDATREHLTNDVADDTGNYNPFWNNRNTVPKVGNIRASVFLAFGLNDVNVVTVQSAAYWDALAARDVPRKIWVYQGGHVDPFDVRRAEWVDTLHRWFDFWLQGRANGIMSEPRASVETSPGTWVDQADWPAPGSRAVTVAMGPGNGFTGVLGGPVPPAGTVRKYADRALSEAEAVTAPTTPRAGRLVFLSGRLTGPLHISGTPSATLRVRVNRPTTHLSVRLVDYGTATRIDAFNAEGVVNLTTESCWGESTPADDACYLDTAAPTVTSDHFVITRGWKDAAHHQTLKMVTPLQPDQWYTITVPIHAHDAVVPTGHNLGLVLGQSDPGYTGLVAGDATVEVDLSGSSLRLPVARGSLPPAWTTVPDTSDAVGPTPVRPRWRPGDLR